MVLLIYRNDDVFEKLFLSFFLLLIQVSLLINHQILIIFVIVKESSLLNRYSRTPKFGLISQSSSKNIVKYHDNGNYEEANWLEKNSSCFLIKFIWGYLMGQEKHCNVYEPIFGCPGYNSSDVSGLLRRWRSYRRKESIVPFKTMRCNRRLVYHTGFFISTICT